MRMSSRALSVASFFVAAVVAAPALAVGEDEASGTAKGTIGGALLGAELVLVVEAALDVPPTWPYIVGGAAGAIGGGVGGYFIEQSASPRVSMLMLAGGLTLAIPTTVAVLSATAYEPPADYLQDSAPPDEPVADPPQPTELPGDSTVAPGRTGETPRARQRRVAHRAQPNLHSTRLRLMPPALLDVGEERIALSIPAVEVRDVFTPAERFVFGVRQATEVRVPVLAVAF